MKKGSSKRVRLDASGSQAATDEVGPWRKNSSILLPVIYDTQSHQPTKAKVNSQGTVFPCAKYKVAKAIEIGEEATSIGEKAFRGCQQLAFVVIPDSVTSIGEYAFSECIELTSQ